MKPFVLVGLLAPGILFADDLADLQAAWRQSLVQLAAAQQATISAVTGRSWSG